MKRRLVLVSLIAIFLLSGCNNDFEKERLEQALKALRAGEYEESIAAYEEILEKEKKSEEAYLGLSNVYAEQQKMDEAINVLKEGIDIVKDKTKLLLELGKRYFATQDFRKAEEAWLDITDTKKDHLVAYRALVQLYQSQNEGDKASKLIETAVKENEENVKFHSLAANVHIKNEEMDKAITAIQNGLNLDINENALYESITYAYNNGYSQIASKGEEQIKADKKKSSGYMMAFYGHFLDGEFEKAIEAAEPIKKKMQDEALKVRLALSYHLTGKESTAKEMMDSIDLNDIENVNALSDILFYYQTIGELEKAISLGEEMLEKHKDEKLYWLLYDFTKDEKFLQKLGLLDWSHELSEEESLEIQTKGM